MEAETAIDAAGNSAPAPPPPLLPAPPAEAAKADFSHREFGLRELMDEPCTFADYSAAALDLAHVNRLTLGHRPTLNFLARVVAKTGVSHEPLHIVDIGCASGDNLRAISRWAAKRSVPLRLTGVDINPYAARLARQCDREHSISAGTIDWITADAFAIKLTRPPDVILSSLFTHHLDDGALVRFLRWSEANARIGWMINDLDRSERASRGFQWLARIFRWHRFVAHDGSVSFRRAFRPEDWQRYLAEAGVEGASIYAVRPGRICVEHLKITG